MAETNCDDAYSIVEGDRVQLKTDDGDSFDVTCTDYSTHNALDPGVVEETMTWHFEDAQGNAYMLQKVEGLKRFPDQADYPYEMPLAEDESPPPGKELKTYGYIESVNTLEAQA